MGVTFFVCTLCKKLGPATNEVEFCFLCDSGYCASCVCASIGPLTFDENASCVSCSLDPKLRKVVRDIDLLHWFIKTHFDGKRNKANTAYLRETLPRTIG